MRHLCMFVLAIAILTPASFSQETGKDEPKDQHKKGEHGFTVKELTAFHDVLHPLVHDALPSGDFGRIRNNLEKLLKKATAIQKARIPKGLVGRKQEITSTRDDLVRQLNEMISMKDKVDDETMEKTFNEMHDTFEQLAELFR